MEKKVLKKDDVKWRISVVFKKDCWARERNDVYYCTVKKKANEGDDDGEELKFGYEKSSSSPMLINLRGLEIRKGVNKEH